MKPIKVLSLPSMHPYMSKLDDGEFISFINPNTNLFDEPQFSPDFLDKNYPAKSYDVVHIHFSFDHVSPKKLENAIKYFKERKKPLVWTAHSMQSLRKKNLGKGKYRELLFENSDAIISPTEGCKNQILDRFGSHEFPIKIIPLGYMADPNEVERISKRIKKDPKLFTYLIGDFRENKEIIQSIINFTQCSALDDSKLQLIYKPMKMYKEDNTQIRDARMEIFYYLTKESQIINLSLPFIENEVLIEAFVKSHAIIMPYKWGTHSGQIELARDCGCHALITSVGYYREQWEDVYTWTLSNGSFRDCANEYTQLLIEVKNKDSLKPAGKWRIKELEKIIKDHYEIYTQLLNKL